MFSDHFTLFPDSGVVELHCCRCSSKWPVAYHPSLDAAIAQAQAHDLAEHSHEPDPQ